MRIISIEGQRTYSEVRDLQKKILQKRIDGSIEDTVLFLEHLPVVTQGRGLQKTGEDRPRHMPLPILPDSIEFCESERGGDLTYHGPGQLVIYPIVHLGESLLFPEKDIDFYIRFLEKTLFDILKPYGLVGEHRKNATGVWVNQMKIASIGIALRKWVTYHGIAINVVNSMKPFQLFSPCGFQAEIMTNLESLLKENLPWEEANWRGWLETLWARQWGGEIESSSFENLVSKFS